IPGVALTGDPTNRLPGLASFTVEGIGHSAYLVNSLNEVGISVSSGSACSAASREASHVLLALGYDAKHASSSLRISLGRENNEEEVKYLLSVLPDIIMKLRDDYAKNPLVMYSDLPHPPDLLD
ncbi:MAG: aminotransferase class V-fold PLP-dependent enzyme, partial [Oscillospiraceae bacterium]|nr:aminotransferase class V-fold PLP-dependent enzyme [Oscillospiraceae bacterium]